MTPPDDPVSLSRDQRTVASPGKRAAFHRSITCSHRLCPFPGLPGGRRHQYEGRRRSMTQTGRADRLRCGQRLPDRRRARSLGTEHRQPHGRLADQRAGRRPPSPRHHHGLGSRRRRRGLQAPVGAGPEPAGPDRPQSWSFSGPVSRDPLLSAYSTFLQKVERAGGQPVARRSHGGAAQPARSADPATFTESLFFGPASSRRTTRPALDVRPVPGMRLRIDFQARQSSRPTSPAR